MQMSTVSDLRTLVLARYLALAYGQDDVVAVKRCAKKIRDRSGHHPDFLLRNLLKANETRVSLVLDGLESRLHELGVL